MRFAIRDTYIVNLTSFLLKGTRPPSPGDGRANQAGVSGDDPAIIAAMMPAMMLLPRSPMVEQ